MFDLRTIIEIRKAAISSIKRDSDDEKITSPLAKCIYIFSSYLLPFSASLISWIRDVKLTDIQSYVGTSIAIFTGLFFSLLLTIGNKIRTEKENVNKDELNFQRYKSSMKQIANITLYTIVLGVVVFLTMLLNSLFKSECVKMVEKIFTSFAIFVLVQFIVSLFYIIQRFYYLIRDEINNIL